MWLPTSPHRVAYHASCHGVRALHLGERPYKLLAKVRGLSLATLPNVDRCCGLLEEPSPSKMQRSRRRCCAVQAAGCDLDRREYCTALDNSCLIAPGRRVHRQYAGMKNDSHGQILASTEETPAEATL